MGLTPAQGRSFELEIRPPSWLACMLDVFRCVDDSYVVGSVASIHADGHVQNCGKQTPLNRSEKSMEPGRPLMDARIIVRVALLA